MVNTKRLGVIVACLCLIGGYSAVGDQLLLISKASAETTDDAALKLWYDRPAREWVEALPVGNGRLGAMIFGGIDAEHLQVNEDTVWVGKPHDYSHPGAYEVLDDLRQLLFAGKQAEAEDLAMERFMSDPLRQMPYQKFVDLTLQFPHDSQGAKNYRRRLDLNTACATVSYKIDDVTYTRKVFSSYPDQVLVMRISADQKGKVEFTAKLEGGHEGCSWHVLGPNRFALRGKVQDDGIAYEAQMLILLEDGQIAERKGEIIVQGSSAVTLLLSGATNYVNYKNISADPAERNNKILAAVENKSFDQLRQAHIQDYQKLFQRVSIDLGPGKTADLPTDQRIKAFAQSEDPQMLALLYQYGRYLMISSSRPGAQPANLQGIWNDSNSPPWDSKYTVNINIEMNYWLAEPTDLTECFEPLVSALQDLSVTGAKVAKVHYNAPGWVLHHNFDLWRGAAPINRSNHGIWPTGGAWFCQHLWDHYLYGGDETWLREVAYPLMKESARFHLKTLVEHPTKGVLISGPGNSPEHGGLVMGPTMDHQIIRNLFLSVIAASEVLHTDPDFRGELQDAVARIAPDEIGSEGQLKEWVDREEPHTNHRHVSHLWGLHPGSEITPLGTPDLVDACKKTLEFRGDASTGWSMAWKMNFWARLWDGNHSFVLVRILFDKGLYPNLFDSHPPFQIDGNFGFVAGVTEWLLQSQDPYGKPGQLNDVFTGKKGYLHLLPSLPDAVPAGSITGLRARGGFTVNLHWADGALQKAEILSRLGKPLTVRCAGKEVSLDTEVGKTYMFDQNLQYRVKTD